MLNRKYYQAGVALIAMGMMAAAGCGSGSDSGGSGGGGNLNAGQGNGDAGTEAKTGTVAPVTCDSLWAGYVQAHPVGLYEERKTVTETELPGGRSSKTETLEKTKVLESSAVQVTVRSVVDQVAPNPRPGSEKQKTMKREDFDKFCQQGTPAVPPTGTLPTDGSMTVLAEGDVTLTVMAGTFACKYRKVSFKLSNMGETVMETWTSVSGTQSIAVKSISVTTIKMGTVTQKSTSTTELVKRQ